MSKLSVVIPAYKEPYLQNTIDDLFEKADSEIEVIVVLDGWWPDKIIQDRPNLIVIHNTARMGMRSSINQGARIATGKYLMKCDAHCAFAYGFDAILKTDCGLTFTMVPARYGLDVKSWQKTIKKFDHQYIEKGTLKGRTWKEKELNLNSYDLMTTQGSCWFMHKDRFFEFGGLDDINYGGMGREAQEISLKTWLSGGHMILNRNTWYAHWDKPKEYVVTNKKDKQKSIDYAVDFWMNDRWHLAKRKLSWLIEKFAPVPSWDDQQVDMLEYLKKFNVDLSEPSPIIVPKFKRRHLAKMFGDLGFKTGAEIGVAYGRYSEVLCKNIPDLKLLAVDPWKAYDEDPRHKENQRENYNQAQVTLTPYNVRFCKAFSMDVVREIEKESLDFVYIDGNHMFDFVMQDIIEWSKRIRSGGVVAGHDYYRFRNAGIIPAVNLYTKIHKIKQFFVTDEKMPSFFWIKP